VIQVLCFERGGEKGDEIGMDSGSVLEKADGHEGPLSRMGCGIIRMQVEKYRGAGRLPGFLIFDIIFMTLGDSLAVGQWTLNP
jgi:hypothetical protein